MNEMRVDEWWNEICDRRIREKPEENLPRIRFFHHVEGPKRELGTQALGDERLTAWTSEPPSRFTTCYNLYSLALF